jgi:glycerol uptake facilitator-like aquaporin
MSTATAEAGSVEPRRDAGIWQKLLAEFLGTLLLLAAVVGSGIMGERLAAGNAAVALLANSVATGAALVALILTFGPISGAHFNPVVTLALAWHGGFPWRRSGPYIVAQIAGAFAGVALAHVMFGLPVVEVSAHVRPGWGQFVGEMVATTGLLLLIFSCVRHREETIPFAVGAYITAAYWFTSSTSFANPAVTLARAMTNTFAGIARQSVPHFLVAQLAAVPLALMLTRMLTPRPRHMG